MTSTSCSDWSTRRRDGSPRWDRRWCRPPPTSPTSRSASSPGRSRGSPPAAYVCLADAEQHIQTHGRAAQEYTLNRESIRYRRASFVEHVQVHKDNPLKLEILHLVRAVRRARAGEAVVLAETEDLRSLAMALEIERMIRDGRCEAAYSNHLPWSAHSARSAAPR